MLFRSDEFEKILSEDSYVVADFWASWCGQCKSLAPRIEKIAEDNKEITFVKIDAEECEDISESYKINSLPTMIFFKNGNEVSRLNGAVGNIVIMNNLALMKD